jgi:hypothetical protein
MTIQDLKPGVTQLDPSSMCILLTGNAKTQDGRPLPLHSVIKDPIRVRICECSQKCVCERTSVFKIDVETIRVASELEHSRWIQ